MTDSMMNFRTQGCSGSEKTPDADILREMIGFGRRAPDGRWRLALIPAPAMARSVTDLLAQRNGYRDRDWGDRPSTVRAAHSEAAHRQLLPVIPGAAANGGESPHRRDPGGPTSRAISTCSVDDLVKALGMSGISKEPGQPALRGD